MSGIIRKKHPLILIMTVLFLLLGANHHVAYGFTDQIIQRGATGDDVVELQARLQYIGFYNGTIDGVFGWSTYWAVRNYQHEFGMKVDGLVGEKMKASLERSTDYRKDYVQKSLTEGRKFTHYGGVNPFEIQQGEKGSATPQKGKPQVEQKEAQQRQQQPKAEEQQPNQPSVPKEQDNQGQEGTVEQPPAQQQPQPEEPTIEQQNGETEQVPERETPKENEQDNNNIIEKAINVPDGFSENDIQLMAQAVYGEARGEPYVGQVAIAAVILNRMNSPTFPNTVSGVIFEPQAFTAVADGQIYNIPNETARKAVLDAINGQDPTGGATYYFNPATATNAWIWSRPQIKKIGKHIFCN